MKSALFSIAVILSVFALTASATAQKKPRQKIDKRYQIVQVNRFDVQQGVDFPIDYKLTIDEDLNKELGRIGGMKQVLRDGETLPAAEPVLLVTGTITKYKKGNQAARYLVGFGAGATVIHAHIKCYDATTKELLLERDVVGGVFMGFIGGKSEGANNDLATDIAEKIQKRFF